MDLKTYLKNLGSLTERERKLVIDAWIEASRVFDDGANRDAQLRIGADEAEQRFGCHHNWLASSTTPSGYQCTKCGQWTPNL